MHGFAFACRRALAAGVHIAPLALLLARGAATALPARGGCSDAPAAGVAIELRAEPAEVAVGEAITIEAHVTALDDGRAAAIPLFRLLGAEPAFAVEAQESSYPAMAYARYRLRAVQPGEATLGVIVNFAATSDCGDRPTLVFRSARSQPVAVRVGDGDGPRTVTPTPTAIPELTPRPRHAPR